MIYRRLTMDKNQVRWFCLACLVWALPAGMVAFFSGRFSGLVIPEGAVAVLVPAFFLLMLGTLALMPDFNKRNGTFLFVGCLTVWALVFFLDQAGHLSREVVGVVGTLNLIVAAGLSGKALATGLMRPAEFVPVCLTAMTADLASVVAGPTQKIAGILEHYYTGAMAGPPPVADYFLIKIPVWGFSTFMPLFGVSDVVFLAFLSAGAGKFKINDKFFNLPIPGIALLFGVFLAHSTSFFIPGIPLLVLFFLPVVLFQSPGARQLKGSDIVYSIVFPAIILLGIRLSSL